MDLIKTLDRNAKISELESKKPSVSGLPTSSALTALKNKTPNVISFVKKIMTQKLLKLKRKLLIIIMRNTILRVVNRITTPEFNKFAKEVFDEKVKSANLLTKTDFDNKLTNLNQKTNSNKAKRLLVENELKKTKNI